MNKIIFHHPLPISSNPKYSSGIRPPLMLRAFQNIGYQVDVVSGYALKRKKSIKSILNNINNNKYDFCYSESSTMPTLLTEINHLPLYPLLDFNFFKLLKLKNIPIGLFYRDIHWQFKELNNKLSFWKRIIRLPFYHYDLLKYSKYVSVLFLPSLKMADHIPKKYKFIKIIDLPPGCNLYNLNNFYLIDNNKYYLNLLYVGGVSPPTYNLTPLFNVVKNYNKLKLTVICRELEWRKIKDFYKIEDCLNIHIRHLEGDDLSDYYLKADIFPIILKNYEYHNFAMPLKLFEALSYAIPIITFNGTVLSDFVANNKIGWVVNNESELSFLLNNIIKDRSQILQLKNHIKKIRHNHTWECRAQKVANIMNNL